MPGCPLGSSASQICLPVSRETPGGQDPPPCWASTPSTRGPPNEHKHPFCASVMPSPKSPQHPSVNCGRSSPPSGHHALRFSAGTFSRAVCAHSALLRAAEGCWPGGQSASARPFRPPRVDVGTQARGWLRGEAVLEILGTRPMFSRRGGCPAPSGSRGVCLGQLWGSGP